MKLIKCPVTLIDVCPVPDIELGRFVFVAGGITNCPDWQGYITEQFKDQPGLFLIDPRRDNFDASDPLMSDKQIEWEFYHLHNSDAIMFWFPEETLCPITLYELGVWAGMGFQRNRHNRKQIFVGCHPNYKRRFDVIKQLSMLRPEVIVRDSLEDLISDVRKFINVFVEVYNLK